jgi:hypothetical protein
MNKTVEKKQCLNREAWSIANAFAYGVRILNAMFCSDNKDEQEYSSEEIWEVTEQVNYMCSRMMMEDAQLVVDRVLSLPEKRLCKKFDCKFHHPDDSRIYDWSIPQEKCDECIHNACEHNKNKKDVDKFEAK